MIRVYVAGAYSSNNTIEVLKNIGKGEKLAAEVFLNGFAPFVPWSDRSFIFHFPEKEFDVKDFYKYSMEWLNVSDCVILVPGWEFSKGTLKEIEQADRLGIPVFKDIESMKNYYKNRG